MRFVFHMGCVYIRLSFSIQIILACAHVFLSLFDCNREKGALFCLSRCGRDGFLKEFPAPLCFLFPLIKSLCSHCLSPLFKYWSTGLINGSRNDGWSLHQSVFARLCGCVCLRLCVCVCACMYAWARVCVCVCVCETACQMTCHLLCLALEVNEACLASQ